ncbi:hypothetical protein IH992_08965 [Candidatus Poribacteria bacterium]|nr:hypothetical protein [Candidatus Poribacteria bacterium]
MRAAQTWYRESQSIRGNSVEARARRIVPNPRARLKSESGRRKGVYLRLEGTAQAVIVASPADGFVIRDALKAELIIATAKSDRRRRITRGSSTHKIQRCHLRGDVYCVIARPLKPVLEGLQSR